MTAENPFLKIRTVGLLYWSIYGCILIGFVLILVDRVLPMGKRTMENIFGGLFYLWLCCWIYGKTKQGNIDIRLFLQRTSDTKWLRLMGLVLCLILFSIGSSSLIANLLIYVRPSLLKLNIASYDHKQSVFNWAIDILTTIVLAPIVEEILFRGILLSRWSSKWGMRKAALISALAFAIPHLSDELGAFLFALCMTILYLRTQTLLIPIAAHALNNTIAMAITFWRTHDATARDTINHFISITWVETLYLAATSLILLAYICRYWPKKEALPPYIMRMNERSVSIEIPPAE
jgi:membrane protease YdiL (CAAX protease family)